MKITKQTGIMTNNCRKVNPGTSRQALFVLSDWLKCYHIPTRITPLTPPRGRLTPWQMHEHFAVLGTGSIQKLGTNRSSSWVIVQF